MARGVIISFDSEVGVGYIKTNDDSPDISFTRSNIRKEYQFSLYVGQEVEFDIVEDNKVLSFATSVRTLKSENSPGQRSTRSASDQRSSHDIYLRSVTSNNRLSESDPGLRARAAATQYNVESFALRDKNLIIRLAAPNTVLNSEAEQHTTDLQPFEAYLDTDNDAVAQRVFEALDHLASILGYEGPIGAKINYGSIWRRAKARIIKILSSQEIQDRLIKTERAFELAKIESVQAEVDSKTANAVAELILSLNDVPQACMMIRSLLLIKYDDGSGPVIITRTLSQVEVRTLERFPEILTQPTEAIKALGTALCNATDFSEERIV